MKRRNSTSVLSSLWAFLAVCSLVFASCGNNEQKQENGQAKDTKTVAKDNKTLTNGGLKVAYVDTASDMLQYYMAKDMEAALK